MLRSFFLLVLISYSGYSQKVQFKIDSRPIKIDSLLWDLDYLSKAPEVKWLDRTGPVQSLLYKGVDYEGHTTQIFAYYSNPDLIAGKSTGKAKYPGVVLIHGGGGKAFKEWVEKWAADGYAAIAMDLSGNGPDGKKLDMAGADQSDENKFKKIESSNLMDVWTYQAVAASILAHSFLLSMPEVDKNKTCVTGISWGGYLTCIVASLDNRFKAAAPVYGCGFYDESDVFKVSLNMLSPAGKSKWMRFFDPSVYLPFAQPKFGFVNGNKDRFYNVVPYSKTYNLVPETNRTVVLIPGMFHSHPHGWEPHEIRYFFESVINQKTPLAKVGKVTTIGTGIAAHFQTLVSLSSADFYYSNDTLSTNEKRIWTKQKVNIDSKKQTLSTEKPESGYKYGFFYVRDHRNLSASSEFIFQ